MDEERKKEVNDISIQWIGDGGTRNETFVGVVNHSEEKEQQQGIDEG